MALVHFRTIASLPVNPPRDHSRAIALLPGNHPGIIHNGAEVRQMTATVTPIRTIRSTKDLIPCQDLRKVGLQSVGKRLSASRGDLDVVFEARAKADVVYCPVCPEPHMAA